MKLIVYLCTQKIDLYEYEKNFSEHRARSHHHECLGFPTKIIIAPDGKIYKSIIGEDPAFYTILDELFGK